MAGERREVVVYFKGVERDLVRSSAASERSLRSVAGTAVKVGAAIAGGFAARKVVSEIGKSIKAQSDLRESVNKVNVIFGSGGSRAIRSWASDAATTLGLTRQQAIANAAAFGDMFDQLGIGRPKAIDMSKSMVKLAADFASFHNADITQVLEAQSAAFRGEYDSLQRFVPGITAARVQQEALRLTHKASVKDLTAAEKAQATYNIMVRDGHRASGDFAKTSEELANAQRIATAQVAEMRTEMGSAFLPAARRLTNHFNKELAPEMLRFARDNAPAMGVALDNVTKKLLDAAPSAQELGRMLRRSLEWVQTEGPRIGESIGQIGSKLTEARSPASELASDVGGLHAAARVAGVVFGYLAEHLDTLAKLMPGLLVAFAALKIAQAAANVAAVADVAMMPARIAATIALARSNQALARSYVEVGVASGSAAAGQSAALVATGGSAIAWGALAKNVGLASAALLLAANANTINNAAQQAGHSIHVNYVAPVYEKLGIYSHARVEQLRAEERAEHMTAAEKQQAALAGYRRVDALNAESAAARGLQAALDNERGSSLDLRQAKLNLSNAQDRLSQLTRDGKKGSNDYKQAQLDLERAQIDVKQKTDSYRGAQARANAATSGAMRAAQNATPPLKKLGDTADTGGTKAGNARIPWRKLGEDVGAAYRQIANKSVHVIANFGWQGLKTFITPGGLKAQKAGGRITEGTTGTADDVLLRVSRGETVVPARASDDPGFQAWAASKRIPGFAVGGRIPRFSMPGRTGFVGQLERWPGRVDAAIQLAAANLQKALSAGFGALGMAGGPGGWQWQMSVLRAVFPGLALISGYRQGAITATGNRSYHASGRAVDVPPIMAVFNWIRAMFGGRTRELIFSPAGMRQIWNGRPHMYTGITRANHWNHIHWAMRNGGNLRVNRPMVLMDPRTGRTVATMGESGPERLSVTPVNAAGTRVDASGAAAATVVVIDLSLTLDGAVLERRLERVRAKNDRRRPVKGGTR